MRRIKKKKKNRERNRTSIVIQYLQIHFFVFASSLYKLSSKKICFTGVDVTGTCWLTDVRSRTSSKKQNKKKICPSCQCRQCRLLDFLFCVQCTGFCCCCWCFRDSLTQCVYYQFMSYSYTGKIFLFLCILILREKTLFYNLFLDLLHDRIFFPLLSICFKENEAPFFRLDINFIYLILYLTEDRFETLIH